MQNFDGVTTTKAQVQQEPQQPTGFQPPEQKPQHQQGPMGFQAPQPMPQYQQGPQNPQYQQGYQAPQPQPQYQQGYQQPAGYPGYQAQPPNYVAYNQGVQNAKDTAHKRLMAQQMMRNIKVSGGGFVILYSLLLLGAGYIAMTYYASQEGYALTQTAFQKIVGRNFTFGDAIGAKDGCESYFAGVLAVPNFLIAFAIFNLMAACFSFCDNTCLCLQGLAALFWFILGGYYSQAKCTGTILLTPIFGTRAIPQNAYPFYLAMGVASLIACFLNYSWDQNKEKARREKNNLALMMSV